MPGQILITIAIVTSFISAYFYFTAFKGKQNNLKHARITMHAMVTSVILASVFLLYLILNHKYEYKYVYEYSGSDLPTGLLISTFYAGQEGSFLLWALFVAILGVFLQQFTSRHEDLEFRVMFIYCLAQGFLLLMINPFVRNPFDFLWSGDAAMLPLNHLNMDLLNSQIFANAFFTDQSSGTEFLKLDSVLADSIKSNSILFSDLIVQGRGLNPLLQNFWMQIHPPILFIGFASTLAPFSFAIAAMLKNEYRNWIKHSLPWILFCSMVLGLGIMLGGYWAYGVLGWGGYWAWDPVENSSLIPWLISVALLHTMLVQKKSESNNGSMPYLKTNIVFSLLSFLLVLYSTFLTRSGVLSEASVHSFGAPGSGTYALLLGILSVFTIFSLLLFIKRWKGMSLINRPAQNLFSKEIALFTGSGLIIAITIVVFVGTSSPLISKAMEISFYNKMSLPLAIIMGLLNGLSIVLKWNEGPDKQIIKQLRFSLILTFIFTLLTFLYGVKDLYMLLFALSSYFTIFVNLEIAVKLLKNNFKKIGAFAAHIGIGIFLLGVLFSSKYDETIDLDLEKNVPNNALGYQIVFTGLNVTPDQKYHFSVDFIKDNTKKTLFPVMFVSEMNQGVMKNPAIWEGLSEDIYLSPLGFDDSQSSGNHDHGVLEIKKGETKKYLDYDITFNSFKMDQAEVGKMSEGGTFSIGAQIEVKNKGKSYSLVPAMLMGQGGKSSPPVELKELNLTFTLENMNAGEGQITLNIKSPNQQPQTHSAPKEVLTVSISRKPFVSLVWIGTLAVVLGILVSVIRRYKESTI